MGERVLELWEMALDGGVEEMMRSMSHTQARDNDEQQWLND